jgi:hypothetical protein
MRNLFIFVESSCPLRTSNQLLLNFLVRLKLAFQNDRLVSYQRRFRWCCYFLADSKLVPSDGEFAFWQIDVHGRGKHSLSKLYLSFIECVERALLDSITNLVIVAQFVQGVLVQIVPPLN